MLNTHSATTAQKLWGIKMGIQEGYKKNFQTLIRAAKKDQLSLMECTDVKTGELVVAICAVNEKDESFEFVPIAKMFNGNPYEELSPAAPESVRRW